MTEGAAAASKEADSSLGPSQPAGDLAPSRPGTSEAERADHPLSSKWCTLRCQSYSPVLVVSSMAWGFFYILLNCHVVAVCGYRCERNSQSIHTVVNTLVSFGLFSYTLRISTLLLSSFLFPVWGVLPALICGNTGSSETPGVNEMRSEATLTLQPKSDKYYFLFLFQARPFMSFYTSASYTSATHYSTSFYVYTSLLTALPRCFLAGWVT